MAQAFAVHFCIWQSQSPISFNFACAMDAGWLDDLVNQESWACLFPAGLAPPSIAFLCSTWPGIARPGIARHRPGIGYQWLSAIHRPNFSIWASFEKSLKIRAPDFYVIFMLFLCSGARHDRGIPPRYFPVCVFDECFTLLVRNGPRGGPDPGIIAALISDIKIQT